MTKAQSAKTTGRKKITVAQYLTQVMEASDKSQTRIAEAMGFQSSNVLTLIKKGRTKLPVSRIPDLARLLEIDPFYLLELAMTEYSPQVWAVIEDIATRSLGDGEKKILRIVREASGGQPVAPENAKEAGELQKLVMKWKTRAEKEKAVSSKSAKSGATAKKKPRQAAAKGKKA